MAGVGMASLSVRASWDTLPRLPYNPHNRRKPKTPNSLKPPLNPSPVTLVASPTGTVVPVAELLRRDIQNSSQVKSDKSYMGYDIWLPSPPKVKKPRSAYNAASLAYLGDCIFELYARRHFLFPPLNMEEYNDRVMAVVRCEAQDALLQKLLDDYYLSEEERDVLRWGKNIGSAKTRTKKRAGVAVYNRASSLETLVGYLYLTDVNRLEEVMRKLGFSTDASTQLGLQETDTGS